MPSEEDRNGDTEALYAFRQAMRSYSETHLKKPPEEGDTDYVRALKAKVARLRAKGLADFGGVELPGESRSGREDRA